MMSLAAAHAGADKKPNYEDSTDSDNDTERKPLLRRISTSKCVGRLVSPYLFILKLVGWACRGGSGAGLHVRARATSETQFSKINFLTILFIWDRCGIVCA